MTSGHAPWESMLCKTGHNFFGLEGKDIIPWNTKQRPKPDNYIRVSGYSFNYLDFDVAVVNNPLGHMEHWVPLIERGIPVILVFHTCKPRHINPKHLDVYPFNRATKVFITEHTKIDWGLDGHVITHVVDTENFKPAEKNDNVLSIVNDWIGRSQEYNFPLYRYLRENVQANYEVIGNTPGLSKEADSFDQLIDISNRAGIFLCTAAISPIPYSLLEAAASGCCIISAATQDIPSYIRHGYNGLLFDPLEPQDAIEYLQLAINNKGLRKEFGMKAREMALNLTQHEFNQKWNGVLYSV